MSDIYVKVGTALVDYFYYVSALGVPVTGKVDGNFTKQVAKASVGNQATTGIVVAEVDSTNNPGVYSVTYNASTSWIAATGYYEVVVFDAASTIYRWASNYLVTADGTGAGTIGAASFTAVALNGRITDGTSALASAEVRIRNSSNVILYQFTSDASGLWGPVYLAAGTYTIDAQKSSYSSSSSATITVSGSTATGPLTDVALTAVTSSTGLLYSALAAYGRRQYGDKVGIKADTELGQIINDALAMVAKERRWPWYLTPGAITTAVSYNTGTITYTSGSPNVTLAGGTFPTWAASGEISINGQWYGITTRTSGTALVLTTAYPGTSGTATGWLVYQDAYSLPSDCMNFHKPLYGKTATWKPMPTDYEKFLEFKTDTQFQQDGATYFCVRRGNIMLAPAPSTARVLNFCYYRKPATISVAADEADWDPMNADVLYRAIDFQVSLRGPCVAGNTQQTLGTYKQAVALATANDKQETDRPSPLSGGRGVSDFDIPAS